MFSPTVTRTTQVQIIAVVVNSWGVNPHCCVAVLLFSWQLLSGLTSRPRISGGILLSQYLDAYPDHLATQVPCKLLLSFCPVASASGVVWFHHLLASLLIPGRLEESNALPLGLHVPEPWHVLADLVRHRNRAQESCCAALPDATTRR